MEVKEKAYQKARFKGEWVITKIKHFGVPYFEKAEAQKCQFGVQMNFSKWQVQDKNGV